MKNQPSEQAQPRGVAEHNGERARRGVADDRSLVSPVTPIANLDQIVDAAEAALMLGVTRQHVVWLLQRGRLPGKRLTATWITTREAVEDYARQRRPPGRPSRPDALKP